MNRKANESAQAWYKAGGHKDMRSSFGAHLSPWDDLGAGRADASRTIRVQESAGKLDSQVSIPDFGLVFGVDRRGSRLVQDQGVDEVAFKSARPVMVNRHPMIEVTNFAGRKRVINCNWLIFCSGMVLRGQGKALREAFPGLTKEDFEFLANGITNKEWEAVFGKTV